MQAHAGCGALLAGLLALPGWLLAARWYGLVPGLCGLVAVPALVAGAYRLGAWAWRERTVRAAAATLRAGRLAILPKLRIADEPDGEWLSVWSHGPQGPELHVRGDTRSYRERLEAATELWAWVAPGQTMALIGTVRRRDDGSPEAVTSNWAFGTD